MNLFELLVNCHKPTPRNVLWVFVFAVLSTALLISSFCALLCPLFAIKTTASLIGAGIVLIFAGGILTAYWTYHVSYFRASTTQNSTANKIYVYIHRTFFLNYKSQILAVSKDSLLLNVFEPINTLEHTKQTGNIVIFAYNKEDRQGSHGLHVPVLFPTQRKPDDPLDLKGSYYLIGSFTEAYGIKCFKVKEYLPMSNLVGSA